MLDLLDWNTLIGSLPERMSRWEFVYLLSDRISGAGGIEETLRSAYRLTVTRDS